MGSCSDNFPRANFFRFPSATRSGEKTVSYFEWSTLEDRMVQVDRSGHKAIPSRMGSVRDPQVRRKDKFD